MAIDFAHPVVEDLYAGGAGLDWPTVLKDNIAAAASLNETVGANLRVGFKRVNNGLFERWDGAAWQPYPLNYLGGGGGAMTGPLGFPARTVGAPGLFVTGDADTGLYSPNANNLAISTAGVERLRVDASGNVNIGIGTPTNYGAPFRTLQVGAANGAAIDLMAGGNVVGELFATAAQVYLSSLTNVPVSFQTGGAERMRIDAAGDVGVGAAPVKIFGSRRTLHLSDTVANVSLRLTGTAGETSLENVGGVTYFSAIANTAANAVMSIRTGGTTFDNANEAVRIDAAGNVGIGRAAGYKLDILAAGQCVVRVIGGAGSNQGAAYYVQNQSEATVTALGQRGSIYGGTPNNDATLFCSGNLTLGAGGFEQLTITSDGVIKDRAGLELGWKGMPSAQYVAVPDRTHRGKTIYATGNVTINPSLFQADDVLRVLNSSFSSSIQVVQGGGFSLIFAGAAIGGTRTLAAAGIAEILFKDATSAYIYGPGVS